MIATEDTLKKRPAALKKLVQVQIRAWEHIYKDAAGTEEAVRAIMSQRPDAKLDPDFTDAWGKLAILYQKDGQSAKATDAFKKAKRLGDANGGTVTRDASGGLQFP